MTGAGRDPVLWPRRLLGAESGAKNLCLAQGRFVRAAPFGAVVKVVGRFGTAARRDALCELRAEACS